MRNRTEEEFDEIIYDDEETACVFFHRKGCHVCEAIEPILKDLEEDYKEEIHFLAVDVEEEKGLFSRLGLKGVPQVLFFQDGSLVKRLAGKREEEEYEDALEELV